MRSSSKLTAGVGLLVLAVGCQSATVTGPGWRDTPPEPATDDAAVPPVEDDASPAPTPARDPEAIFLTAVLPLLDRRCNGCHAAGESGPVFIDLEEPYGSLLESGVVTPGAPGSSSLVTKGEHRGPAWLPGEAQTVTDWILAEDPEAPVDPEPPLVGGPAGDYETAPQAVVDGNNVIALDDVGLPGAELRFVARRVTLGLHLSSITVHAAAEGLVVAHPTLVVHDGDGERHPDPDDRFATVELVVPADGAAILAENVLLVDYPLDAEFSVGFVSTSTL